MPSLPEASNYRATWLETTYSKHGHGGKGWDFGTCLWSPTLNKIGAHYYDVMKEPRRGDLVLHNYQFECRHTPKSRAGRTRATRSAASDFPSIHAPARQSPCAVCAFH